MKNVNKFIGVNGVFLWLTVVDLRLMSVLLHFSSLLFDISVELVLCYDTCTDFSPFIHLLSSCSVRDYLTGFHKRKVERRKAAVAEIRKKIKEEQIRVREEVS